MDIRNTIQAGDGFCVEVTRLEWLQALKQLPKTDDETLRRMIDDHILGATRAGTDVVAVERWQARTMLGLDQPTAQENEAAT